MFVKRRQKKRKKLSDITPSQEQCLHMMDTIVFRSWVPDNSLDRIHDQKVVSIGHQKLTKLIVISQKWHQWEIQIARFRYGTIWKRLNTSKKMKLIIEKNKKSKHSCRTIFTPTNTVEHDRTRCLFFVWNFIFTLFSQTFLGEDFGVRYPPFWNKKNMATSFAFLLRKSGFPIGYGFFCTSIKKLYRRFFCEISAGVTAFR